MRKQVLATKRVTSLGQLKATLESLTIQHPDEILLDTEKIVSLIEETLSDGSKVYNLVIV